MTTKPENPNQAIPKYTDDFSGFYNLFSDAAKQLYDPQPVPLKIEPQDARSYIFCFSIFGSVSHISHIFQYTVSALTHFNIQFQH